MHRRSRAMAEHDTRGDGGLKCGSERQLDDAVTGGKAVPRVGQKAGCPSAGACGGEPDFNAPRMLPSLTGQRAERQAADGAHEELRPPRAGEALDTSNGDKAALLAQRVHESLKVTRSEDHDIS